MEIDFHHIFLQNAFICMMKLQINITNINILLHNVIKNGAILIEPFKMKLNILI